MHGCNAAYRCCLQIPVPSNWECEGHGTPMYTNIQYPWPVDPPFVAAHNPTGCYLRRFTLPDDWSAHKQRCASNAYCCAGTWLAHVRAKARLGCGVSSV